MERGPGMLLHHVLELGPDLLLHRMASDASMLCSVRIPFWRAHGPIPSVFHPRAVCAGSSHSMRTSIGEANDRSVTMKYNVQGMLA